MLTSSTAFSSFSVDDLEKAKDFYTNTLGVKVQEDSVMGFLRLKLGSGAEVMVYPKGDKHSPATFTVLNFLVEDVEKAVDELAAKGVTFQHYDEEYIRTDDKGIARNPDGPAMAWFTDPAGNILSVIQEKN